MSRGRAGEVYNVGGRCEYKNLDLVRQLCRIADEAFEAQPALRQRFPRSRAGAGCAEAIEFVQDRPGHDRRYAIDPRKLEEQIGFRCQHTLEDGLRDTFSWYLQHETWWRRILDGSYRELGAYARAVQAG